MKGQPQVNVRGMAVKARDLIESIQGLCSLLCHIPSHPPSRHLITTTTIIFITIFIINMHSFPPYMEEDYALVIKPARKARGPEGPAR